MVSFLHRPSSLVRLAIFVAGAVASLALGIVAGSMIIGMVGGARPLVVMSVISALASAGLLLVTGGLLQLEGAGLSALGLPIDRQRVGELGAGFVISMALFLAVAWVQSAMVGASWHFQSWRDALAAVADLPLVFCLVLAEELLFRGFALHTLRKLTGDRAAIVVTAAIFGVYHVLGTQYWGMGLVFQILMPALGGLLFAWAAVRSGGLALPIGLHLGGNWVQASVAAFSLASPTVESMHAVWRIPVSAADVQVLTAPDLLPRLPFVLAVALAAILTWQMTAGLHGHPLTVAPPKQ